MLPKACSDLQLQDLLKRSQTVQHLLWRGQSIGWLGAVADSPDQDSLPTEA